MKREEYERLLLARLHARHRWETLPAAGWLNSMWSRIATSGSRKGSRWVRDATPRAKCERETKEPRGEGMSACPDFRTFFHALWGYDPFPWQEMLAREQPPALGEPGSRRVDNRGHRPRRVLNCSIAHTREQVDYPTGET